MLRCLSQEHLPKVYAFSCDVFSRTDTPNEHPSLEEMTARYLNRRGALCCMFSKEDEGGNVDTIPIAAYLMAYESPYPHGESSCLHVWLCATHENFRGRGFASKMFAEMEKVCVERNLKSLRVNTYPRYFPNMFKFLSRGESGFVQTATATTATLSALDTGKVSFEKKVVGRLATDKADSTKVRSVSFAAPKPPRSSSSSSAKDVSSVSSMSSLTRGTHRDRICTTPTIPTLNMRQLLSLEAEGTRNGSDNGMVISLLRVPPFQRRYCWGTSQIAKYLDDIAPLCRPIKAGAAAAVVAKSKNKNTVAAASVSQVLSGIGAHSFGRVVMTRRGGDGKIDHDLTVIDGQQRCTTTCILLTSLRDFVRTHVLNKKLSETLVPLAQSIIEDIDAVLFPMGAAAGCVIQPTYFDRQSFVRCVSSTNEDNDDDDDDDGGVGGHSHTSGLVKIGPFRVDGNYDDEDHVLGVRSLFDDALYSGKLWNRISPGKTPPDGENILDYIVAVYQAVLDKVCVLYFLTAEEASEAQAVYARLAIRDKGLTKQLASPAPGVSLDAVDLCRNVILSVFSNGTEAEQIAVFEEFWAPLESLAHIEAAKVNTVSKSHSIQSAETVSLGIAATADQQGPLLKRHRTLKMVDILSAMLVDFIAEEAALSGVTAPVDPTDYAEIDYGLYCRLRSCIECEILKARNSGSDTDNDDEGKVGGEGEDSIVTEQRNDKEDTPVDMDLFLRKREQRNVLGFLRRFLNFGQQRWKDTSISHWAASNSALRTDKVQVQSAGETRLGGFKKECWCISMGTKCTDCIVKLSRKP